MKTFSFTQDVWRGVHNQIKVSLPGVQKVVSIYMNDRLNALEAVVSGNMEAEAHDFMLDIHEVEDLIKDLRKSKVPFHWLDKDDIPFEFSSKRITEKKDLFDEKRNTFLLLRFNNPADGMSDLLFVYLKDTLGNFGVKNSKGILSTETKSAIAFVIHNQIRGFLLEWEKNKLNLLEYNAQTHHLISQLNAKDEELLTYKKETGRSRVLLCNQYLNEISRNQRKVFKLSKNAELKIAAFSGEIMKLQNVIVKAANFAFSLNFNSPHEIILEEWFINFEEQKTEDTKGVINKDELPRTNRTINFLDRMEYAAVKLKKDDIKMNGTNLGQAFEKPISAPAISDALYNHKARIINLFRKYPERWLTIKNEFRPMKRLAE